MTMLYRLSANAAAIVAQFGVFAGNDPWSGGTIAPGQFAPVITAGREFVAGPAGERQPKRLIPRQWGVPPPPNAGDTGRPVLTVRNPESPFWIGNLRNAEFRCLLPASTFMEWGRTDPTTGKRRQHWFVCADQPLFGFAGVWKDSEVPSFALLTCNANALLRDEGIERMPVILPISAHDLWLRGGWDKAGALIAPYSSSMMRDHRSDQKA